MSELQLVLVIGKGRSGSTLLDDLLGTMPGVTSTGELGLMWKRGRQKGHVCTCGRSIADCPVWSSALRAAIGGADADRLGAVARLQAETFRWSRVPGLMFGATASRDRRLGEILSRVYRGVADATNARVIVDSSKWPAHPALFGLVPGVTPFLLHLIRDPRAVAHSYRRAQARDIPPTPGRYGAVASALSWDARNVAAEFLSRKVPRSRCHRVRYEDLVARPRATIAALGAWLGIADPERAFIDATTVHLGDAHLIGGNRRRFNRGEVTILADDEWKSHLSTRDHRIVSVLTTPLRHRYGYRNGTAPHR